MQLITRLGFLFISLQLLPLIGLSAFGEEITPHVTTQLVSEVVHVENGQPFWVGIHLKMEPEWHTYWENPGEAGLATSIEWNLPEGFQVSSLHWPVPQRFELNDFVNYGYEGEILLMAMITPPANLEIGKEISIKAKVNWLECKETCIPGEAEHTLALPIVSHSPEWNPDWHSYFHKSRLDHPIVTQAWQVTAHYHNNELGLLIVGKEDNLPSLKGDISFFSKNPDIHLNKDQPLTRLKQGYFLKLTPSDEFKPGEKNTLSGILYNPNGWLKDHPAKALAIHTEVIQGLPQTVPSVPPAPASSGILKAVLFAFIGGIILNLMPCVFPVLSIKILSFIQKSGQDSRKLKLHGILFSMGVLASFWVLSFLLIALRASGEQLGWGFQLQSSYFVIFLCGLLVLIGLNFAGVFEIGTRLSNLGGKIKNAEGFLGSFSSGVLATVLATPCTAPFMGSALGFALSQAPLNAFYIFSAIAAGMALPYIFLSFFPKCLQFLPRPGPWMETFKQAMAFPMFGTVLWLLWVFSHSASSDELIAVLFALLIISFAAWIYGRFVTHGESRLKRINGTILTLLLLTGGAFIGYEAVSLNEGASSSITQSKEGNSSEQTYLGYSGLDVQPFSEELLENLRREGKGVFVDFTARWCLTCQVNKKIVFGNKKVRQYFKNHDIVILKADWTNHNASITESLNAFGRSGVPFNVYYPPSASAKPVPLPEVLTPKIVLDTLKKVER